MGGECSLWRLVSWSCEYRRTADNQKTSQAVERSIALARLPAGDYDRAQVEVRGRLLNVRIVKPPFVRNGKVCIDV